MKCTLIGMGCGIAHLTTIAQSALYDAQVLIGARRLLEMVPCCKAERIAEYRPQEIVSILRRYGAERSCVLYSGDSGFYSGAAGLIPFLQEIEGMEIEVLPGISSLQEFAARLGEPWQDWRLCSAHGTSCDPVYEIMQGQPIFYLTSGAETPREICTQLVEAGLGTLGVAVGENLGTTQMQIWKGTAAECVGRQFSPLNVLRVEAAPRYPVRTPGLPDDAFVRGHVPMTKQVVRAAILSQLAVTPEDVCWDIGAGTGSVSVELALHARSTWAVEQNPKAIDLIRQNRERFCAWNLHVIEGTAPEALAELPRPDVAFIGGSGGQMEAILRAVLQTNPAVRLCISAIALETLQETVRVLEALGHTPAVTQIAVSQTRAAGSLHLLMAQNPVFLITAERS